MIEAMPRALGRVVEGHRQNVPKVTALSARSYRHYKGMEYTVLGVARHSETREELVVYRQEYGDQGLWVRPKQMFLEMVKVEGQTMPQFQDVGGQT